jgi:hypothetical protein
MAYQPKSELRESLMISADLLAEMSNFFAAFFVCRFVETPSSHLYIAKKLSIPAQLSGTFSLMLFPDSKSGSGRKSEA